jgi:hypothetical protein
MYEEILGDFRKKEKEKERLQTIKHNDDDFEKVRKKNKKKWKVW